MKWTDKLLGAPHPQPQSPAVPLRPLHKERESIADRKAAEAKWAADAEVLERFAESPLYARTILDLGDPLPGYVREIEPFTMHRRDPSRHELDELDGPIFRQAVRA